MNGLWFFDGIDIYLTFGVVIESGSADWLKPAPRKASIEHDWKDSNGKEIDTERFFFESREGTLNMAMIANTEEEFLQKLEYFISHLTQPGKRRFSLKSHGENSYYIIYKETNNFTALKPLKGSDLDGKVVYRFSMAFIEPEPQVDNSHIFLVSEDNVFIIT